MSKPGRKPLYICVASFSAALLSLGFAPVVQAQSDSDSASGAATAHIVDPIAVSAVSDLDFGGIAASPTASGTVTVDPSGGAVSYQGVSQVPCGSGQPCTPHPAQFNVRGEVGREYRVDIPSEVQAYLDGGAAPVLLVDELQAASANLPGNASRGLLGIDGGDRITVGGTLNVPAGVIPGRYVAQLQVVVSYD